MIVFTLVSAVLLQADVAEKLIEQLRSESVETRESAARELTQMGRLVIPKLDAASRDADVEVAQRALTILAAIDSEVARSNFSKIEQELLKARTLKTSFTSLSLSTTKGSIPRTELSGTLMLTTTGKILLKAQSSNLSGKSILSCVSDGFQLKDAGPEGRTVDLPARLGADCRRLFLWGGAGTASMFLSEGAYEGVSMSDFTLSNFKNGAEKGSTKILSYDLARKGVRGVYSFTLWYEAAPLKITKRYCRVKYEGEGNEGSVSEEYSEFQLDVALTDDHFTLPQKK